MTDWTQLPVGPGSAMVVAVVNHLWQSSVFAVGAWLLTLALRRNQARTRYQLWMLASAKFLVPFSLLMMVGERFDRQIAKPTEPAAYSWVSDDLATPYKVSSASVAVRVPVRVDPGSKLAAAGKPSPQRMSLGLILMAAIAGCGSMFVIASWLVSWLRLRRLVRGARLVGEVSAKPAVPIFETQSKLEPGVFGILRPVLLLPEGIRDRLTGAQMEAILAHELCHVQRRDNLTAAMHMLVEAIFWFHPMVWWIRRMLIEERERACDEAVLASSGEAETYAEGILNVCKLYLEAPLSCVSGVTGSDLKKRIARIMSEQKARSLDLGRKLLLGVAGMLAVAIPVSFGLVHAAAQTAEATGIVGTWQGRLMPGSKSYARCCTLKKTTRARSR